MNDTAILTTPQLIDEALPAPYLIGRVPAHILVVDDEPRIRGAIRTCLELEGYEIREARDGRAAFRQIVESSPDLVILDLAMPELDGLSLMRLLNGALDKPAPRIVVLTAYGSISAAVTAQQHGARGFLEKPLVPDTLREVVWHALHDDREPSSRDASPESPIGPPWFG